jgi:hypothetical protein
VRKAKAIYDLGSNKFIDVLYAHSPELVGHGCEENLKRFWNFLLVSGTVLNQLINNCEFFVLTYYSKKIQKQWRTVRTRRYFAAILSRSKYLSSLTQKAKFWKEETGFKLSTFGRCDGHVAFHPIAINCKCFFLTPLMAECKCSTFAHR